MYLLSRGGSGSESSPLEWLTLRRLALSSRTLIGVYAVFLGAWAWVAHGFTAAGAGRPGADFAIFWATAHLLVHGSPLEVYDYHSFIANQLALLGDFAERYALPWAYPPAYVLFIAPLSLLPFALAYLLFTGIGAFLLVKGTLLVSQLGTSVRGEGRAAALFIAVSPCVFVAAIIGQNSLWTAAVAVFAMHWLRKAPLRAGICIGLLAIKPQIAIVFPFVLIAARA
jgi:alpha-1,2-mannosyltransferase